MHPVKEYQIYENVKEYLIQYPSFSKLIIFKFPSVMRESGWEIINGVEPNIGRKHLHNSKEKSLIRTRKIVSDLVICNDFDLFCTFTFAKDRQNVDLIFSRMYKWLQNQREIHGKFSYLLVPEYHKDGVSVHFHALFSGYKGRLRSTGVYHNDMEVFNLTSFRMGHTTATKIVQKEKVSSYIKKYITKDMPTIKNKNRFATSTGLKRPIKIRNPKLSDQAKKTYTTIFENDYFTLLHSYDNLRTQLTN
jgi:hypothetical protein